MSYFNSLTQVQEIDEKAVRGFPREYAALAYLLEKSGFPIRRGFPTRACALEAEIKAAGTAWLDEA